MFKLLSWGCEMNFGMWTGPISEWLILSYAMQQIACLFGIELFCRWLYLKQFPALLLHARSSRVFNCVPLQRCRSGMRLCVCFFIFITCQVEAQQRAFMYRSAVISLLRWCLMAWKLKSVRHTPLGRQKDSIVLECFQLLKMELWRNVTSNKKHGTM